MNNILALFDLDHTLIPADSDLCWTKFLIDKGVIEKENTRVNENFFTQYNDGCLDIYEFLSFQLKNRVIIHYPTLYYCSELDLILNT